MRLVHGLYLHGFGSGPATAKGCALGEALAERLASWRIPALDGGDFSCLTVEGMAARACDAAAELPSGEALLVCGSSLGGWLAALLATELAKTRPLALLLIAPAFGLTKRWRQILSEDELAAWRRSGSRLFWHHIVERELPLHDAFIDSVEAWPSLPPPPGCPCVVVHGWRDETVAWREALAYAQQDPAIELHLLDGEHGLTLPTQASFLAQRAVDLIERLRTE